LALGGFSRGAAEPFSLAEYSGVGDFSLVIPESASVFSRDPELNEQEPADFDAQPPTPSESAVDGELPDAWAEAFASGSRLPASLDIVEAPEYPVVVTPQVQRFLDLFTGQRREIVSVWVNRSGRYLSMIRGVLRSRGLPEELAYTAMIESGFKPDAVSRAGAKGMWQFMAATARRYGLRVDRWVDERYDPEKSTVAAAGYLRDLYTQFGSWPLAQAAYNAGEVKVARAIQNTGSVDFWTLAESKWLRRETKDFVPQIHAATVIARDPDRYGFEFDDLDPVAVDTVRVPPGTDLRRLAASSGVPFQTLHGLNRVLVRAVTPPGKLWELRVPPGTSDSVMAAVAPRRPATAVASAGKKAPGKATRVAAGTDVHIVRPKDTVASIARRYGISVGDVLRWNSLERQAQIRPGDRLRVATRPSVEPDGQGGFR
jgi:membrane-bound lytic murein transglycosylase D